MKQVNTTGVLNASTKIVSFEIPNFNLNKLLAIINQSSGDVIYATGTKGKGFTSFTSSSITLEFDTTAMSNSDEIQIIYDNSLTENGAIAVGNAVSKFRDGFALGLNPSIWDSSWTNQNSGKLRTLGNSSGASYLQITMSPFAQDSEFTLLSKEVFKLPCRFGFGASISQRIIGQEVEFSLVGCDVNGVVENNSIPTATPISGTVSVTSNVATINFASPHPYRGADRVVLSGNFQSQLNVGPVVATIVNQTQITVPCTLANGTYTAGGTVAFADIFDYAKNAVGYVYENTSATNATFVTRRNGSSHFGRNNTVASTAALVASNQPLTESFRSSADNELIVTMEDATMISRPASNITSFQSGQDRLSESLPDEDRYYKLRVRVRNLPNLTVPVAEIVSSAKTGTTTATHTTATPHGLTTGDVIQIYGNRDITNFPNLTAQTVVASIVDATTFTVVQGGAVTASTTGGVLWKNNGNVLAPGAFNFSIQSISASGGFLTTVLNTTASGFQVGEAYELYGLVPSASAYNGTYILRIISGTSLIWQKLDGTAIPDITSTNTGGAIILTTNVRAHYIRDLGYTSLIAEFANARGNQDVSKSMPVSISGTPAVSISGTPAVSISGTPAVTVSGNAAAAGLFVRPDNITVGDIASAAITSSATTAAITPHIPGGTAEFNLIVTAVSGANPTMDVSIEESDDNGTNWYTVYTFPRITAVGQYRTPALPLNGNRVRYVQTIGGTTPSFTRLLNRVHQSQTISTKFRQLIDRVVAPNTANSTTASLLTNGSKNVQMVVNMGAITTTAPAFQIQGSDDNGVNWYSIGTPLTAVASSSVTVTVNNVHSERIQAIVSTVGVGATLGAGGVLLKAFS